MAREILPLTLADVPELSRFLTAGFHTPSGADYAAPDVLCWKYLEPMNTQGKDAGAILPRGVISLAAKQDRSSGISGYAGPRFRGRRCRKPWRSASDDPYHRLAGFIRTPGGRHQFDAKGSRRGA